MIPKRTLIGIFGQQRNCPEWSDFDTGDFVDGAAATAINTSTGYNKFAVATIEPCTGKLIVAFSAGGGGATAHSYSTASSLVAVENDQSGSGWGSETTIAATADDDTPFGSGVDNGNKILVWHRRRKALDDNATPSDHELWRRTGVGTWSQVTTITAPTYEMTLIMDITKLSTGRLVSWWHNESWDYGILYSDDNGTNWTQVRIGAGLAESACPVEINMTELAGGDLLAIGRSQASSGTGALFQLTCDVSSGGDMTDSADWTLNTTNIADGTYTAASITNRSDTLDVYYMDRIKRDLKWRHVAASTVYGSPTAWPASRTIDNQVTPTDPPTSGGSGAEDAGYPRAVKLSPELDVIVWYSDSFSAAPETTPTEIVYITHDTTFTPQGADTFDGGTAASQGADTFDGGTAASQGADTFDGGTA